MPAMTLTYAAIALTGPDVAALLNPLLTVDVDPACGASAAEPLYGALLTPQGKILNEMAISPGPGDGVTLTTPADARDGLLKRLGLYKLRADVVITPGDAEPSRLGLLTAADAPHQGLDYGEADVFPTDVNLDLLGGVDYKKGCFVGQEVASRMRRRGSIRKRTLIAAAPDGADLAVGGAITDAEGAKIGVVTSAQGGRGLALVRIDRLLSAGALDAALTIENTPVTLCAPPHATLDDLGLTTSTEPS